MEEGKNLTWYLGRIQKIVKHHEKGVGIDYVQPVPINESGIHILVKYYKQMEGFCYSYGGYGGYEADFIKLEHVICLIGMSADADCENFLLDREDKKTLDNFVKNEQRRRQNGGRRSVNVSTSAEPTTHEVSTQPSRPVATQIGHITRSGRRATRLVNC